VIKLGISEPKVRLPASSFPERADIYFCDKCARDITHHLHRRRSHSWAPIGPMRYTCLCGQQYLTGALEWMNLSDWEQSRRTSQTLGLGLMFSVMSSVLGLLAYWLLRALQLPRLALVFALIITVAPFVLFMVPFCYEVAMSKWRTRARTLASSHSQ